MTSILDSPGIPKQGDSPTFNEPWEARAFAMVLMLQQRGLFTWPDWTAALAAEIALAQQRGDRDLGDTYYKHWLQALEKLLVDRGALTV
jgi:nitrile hydratase accessory protein